MSEDTSDKCCESQSSDCASDCQELDLQPGTYWLCACGKSEKMPFCNGAHKAEGKFKPVKVEVKEQQSVKWCSN